MLCLTSSPSQWIQLKPLTIMNYKKSFILKVVPVYDIVIAMTATNTHRCCISLCVVIYAYSLDGISSPSFSSVGFSNVSFLFLLLELVLLHHHPTCMKMVLLLLPVSTTTTPETLKNLSIDVVCHGMLRGALWIYYIKSYFSFDGSFS